MAADTLQKFKVKRSKVKVTVCNISAVKRYKSGTDRLTDFTLGENHPSVSTVASRTVHYQKTSWHVNVTAESVPILYCKGTVCL